ncbi:MAG: PCMD domain-containing protein [Bacteroidales bacterium]|nr:PCMD domain-containing protein [Bacteroidales bacterium]MBQ6742558.1 PCMD domain-containing protein [Bacteroidales bacterium]MBQ6742615.1 PCMD domain-containing protein [Bacteroidales bacterium]
MKLKLLTLAMAALTIVPSIANAQKKIVPYGKFESWCVRHIKESPIIGGNTKTIYNIGPKDTINENQAYKANTPWCSSNAYAKVSGVTKTSCTVTPAKSWDGSTCAKLETKYETLKVAGMVNLKLLVSGCIFWGKIFEPIKTANNPYALMNWGIPFTERPTALILDYKSEMPNKGTITKCKPATRVTSYAGNDSQEIIFILQKRWEDEDGHVHALRVGTAIRRIENPSNGWVKNYKVPVIYGDARKDANYKDYMKLGPKGLTYYAKNSKGKVVKIQEEGWAEPDETPTHAMLIITASVQEAFVGTVGNTMWVDNVALEY